MGKLASSFVAKLKKHPSFKHGRLVLARTGAKQMRLRALGRTLDAGEIMTQLTPYPAEMTPDALAEKFIIPLKDKGDVLVVGEADDGRLLVGRAHDPTWEANMSKGEFTSEEIASIAARGVRDPKSLTEAEIKAVCGSAMTQVRNRDDPEKGRKN
jgi:hypothetical protein